MSHQDIIAALEEKLKVAEKQRRMITEGKRWLSVFEEQRLESLDRKIETLKDKIDLERRQMPLLDEEL